MAKDKKFDKLIPQHKRLAMGEGCGYSKGGAVKKSMKPAPFKKSARKK